MYASLISLNLINHLTKCLYFSIALVRGRLLLSRLDIERKKLLSKPNYNTIEKIALFCVERNCKIKSLRIDFRDFQSGKLESLPV